MFALKNNSVCGQRLVQACVVQTAWRLYWDKQLLKVLDAQFARDIQSLLPRLPSQHVRLVYTDQAVHFEPPLDDIRAAFYADHLDAFITIPCQVIECSQTSILWICTTLRAADCLCYILMVSLVVFLFMMLYAPQCSCATSVTDTLYTTPCS